MTAQPLWRANAACRGHAVNLFFAPDNDVESRQTALALCGLCPVRAECLDFALQSETTVGIFGGTTPARRKKLRRKLRSENAA